MNRVAAVILAAGASSRMGRAKALLDIAGVPAVDRVADLLREAGASQVVVVLGHGAAEIRAGARLAGATVVDHQGWAAGRTSSLQAGLAAVDPGSAAAWVAPVDVPLFLPATPRALATAFGAARPRPDVVVPVHRGRGGHPILLSRRAFAAVAALGPDAPLRDLLRTLVRLDLPVDDPGCLRDLNEPGDLDHDGTGPA